MKIDLSPTGDPFVDAGGMVFEEYQQKFPKDTTIEQLLDHVARIYIERWGKKLNPLFLNSKITNPSVKENLKETLAYYQTLQQSSDIEGYCKTCGYEGRLFKAGRDVFPLVGSGKFRNFHHAFEEGLYLCASCLIKLFFMPLGVLMLGGRVALLQINSPEVKILWKEETLEKNWGHVGTGSSQEILKSSYKNPVNSLFYFARDLITDIPKYGTEKQTLILYHFTNFGASPDCSIHVLNHKVFQFLAKVLERDLKADWNRFINLNYTFGKKFDVDFQTGKIFKKGETIEQKQEEYQNYKNIVYQKLMGDKSLVELLRKQQEKDWKNNHIFDPLYAYHYGKEILQMTQEQISTLQKLVQEIFKLHENSQTDLEKTLKNIRDAKSKSSLRAIIVRLSQKNYRAERDTPLITLEEINFYLLGSQLYWREVRDYLLIYFFELLHHNKIKISDDLLDEDLPEEELENTLNPIN